MRKKLLFIAAAFAAIVFLTTACERDARFGRVEREVGQRVELSPENPVTITLWTVTSQMAPAPNNRISQILLDRLGVTLVYDITTPDLQDQRVGVMLAGGADLPDLVGSTDQNARLVQGGALLRLDNFLDSGQWPNLAYHIAPYRTRLSWRGGGVPDGLYQFPNYNRFYPPIVAPVHWGTGFWLQKSVLAWHGFPSLENMTLERYFDLIEQYMRAHPTINGMPTIGFSFPVTGRVWGMTNPPLFLAGHPNNGGVMVIDGRAQIYAISQYAEDYFRFLNQAFHRGLVDPETFTQTLDEYFAKLATGRVLGMHDQRWGFGMAYDSLVAAGRCERTWVATMPVFEGRTPWYRDRDVLNIHQGFGISVSAENPEILLTFLDTMLEPEWQILLSWGEEGIDFYVDEDGMFYRSDEQRANAEDLIWRQHNRLEALLDNLPKRQGTFPCGNTFGPGDSPREFAVGLSDYNRSFLQSYGKNVWGDFVNDPPENPVYYPLWQFAAPDGSAAQIANAQMESAALMFLPRLVMSPPGAFDAIWAEYVAHFALIDVEAFETAVNEFMQERIRLAGGE